MVSVDRGGYCSLIAHVLTLISGPRSYLSICSKPAVKWVSEQTRSTNFAESASAFVCDITRRLKMDGDLSISRMPEPDVETAWRYTKGAHDFCRTIDGHSSRY
jgi:hypothetical protein